MNQVGPKAYSGFTHERWAQFLCDQGFDGVVERDHLGKNGEDIKEWVDADVDHGFNCVHLHCFDYKTAQHWISLVRGRLDIQLGPGEDASKPIDPKLFDHPTAWVSFPTGCKIAAGKNDYKLDLESIAAVRSKWPDRLIRGHNCDYLQPWQRKIVYDLVDGINVAPQLGVVQSCFYLALARARGYPISAWADACRADEHNLHRWGKSMELVGHYHFDTLEWRDLVFLECVDFMYKEIDRWLKSVGARKR